MGTSGINPKGLLFFVALVPQFVSPEAALPVPVQSGLLGLTFVVLAAHPDDESLGAGGFLAKLHAAGADIKVLLCTAGEASHPESPTTTP